jgi:adenylate kinase
MTESNLIIVTGLSGSGSKKFCSEYARQENAKAFYTGDLILQAAQPPANRAPMPAENLLNLPNNVMEQLRDKVFHNICDEIAKKEHPRYIIDMHAQFFWNHVFENAFDWRYLEKLNADMYVTIIDKPSSIKARQLETAQGRSQTHDLRDLLLWQNVEVNITKGWADKYAKPMYVLPSAQNPNILEGLLQNYFCMYYQMPMTDANSAENRKISEFKDMLSKIYLDITAKPLPIIDPRDIDIETGAGLSHIEEIAIRNQTNHRDLNWWIGIDATDQVAYYPEGAPISKGVSDETNKGHETGKNTFVVYSKENRSPFMDRTKQVFRTEQEFFEFFRQYIPIRLAQLERRKAA